MTVTAHRLPTIPGLTGGLPAKPLLCAPKGLRTADGEPIIITFHKFYNMTRHNVSCNIPSPDCGTQRGGDFSRLLFLGAYGIKIPSGLNPVRRAGDIFCRLTVQRRKAAESSRSDSKSQDLSYWSSITSPARVSPNMAVVWAKVPLIAAFRALQVSPSEGSFGIVWSMRLDRRSGE